MLPVSRHFLACRPGRVRWLPSPSSGPPDEDGITRTHKLIALSSWSPDQGNQVSVVSVVSGVGMDGALAEPPSLMWHASWDHLGEVTDLQVVRLPEGSDSSRLEVMLLASSSNGTLSRLKLGVPMASGGHSELAKVLEGAGAGRGLGAWAEGLHAGAITAFDVCPWDTLDVVTVGDDGAIRLLRMRDAEARAVEEVYGSRGGAAFSAVRWTSRSNIVTAGSLGGVQTWDCRAPSNTAPAKVELGPVAGAGTFIHSLEVHRHQPHLVAVGGGAGTCLLWDMRRQDKPLALHTGGVEGDLWEVHFDVSEQAASLASAHGTPLPPVWLCAEDGALRAASHQAGGHVEVLQESCAINSFDIEPEMGRDVVCVTDHEGLMHMQRGGEF